MSLNRALYLAFLTVTAASQSGCDNSASADLGATTAAKPTAAAATAAPAAKPAAASAPAAIVGIKAGEILAASCESIEKDSECSDVVVTSEAEKASGLQAMKQFCSGKVNESACSTDKIVGTCRIMKDMITHYSSEGPKKYTVETAKPACEKSHGHWVGP